MTATDSRNSTEFDRDVVVVGGGPAGCSAGIFTARYGLDTVIFDRGNSSLRRCAYLENYLGFPAGIDIDTLYDLMGVHAEEMGCDLVSDMVESVTRTDDESGFVVETQDGRAVTARRVVAASRYDGEYMRPLGGDEMFETHSHGGEEHEHFDPEYADSDSRTPIEGLYVAAPAGEMNAQAIISAGYGAQVGRNLLADYRCEQGYPEEVADHWDWLRRDAELDDEWSDRDRWREWFEGRIPDDHGLGDDRLAELREADIDRSFETYLAPDEIEDRERRGLARLVETVGPDRVLDALDDERIREYLDSEEASAES
ncbi:NAD(P)/FAD-dependent oxidoreductase [Halorussus amylolyticus]|uniref:NAD(P)/FAD-dependent oxidoreductase n=1 Tax=Halorussus amylolyticus TaxID=1126242 RepID=UPI00104573F0|nr:NAD(P)/FAD-dependent oxidoreductase [Halorussus amylolyticus]